ncbi:MAG: hypothetical protein BroJett025_10700 [Patescibacteria group bacterium]|nr:MAG: hypothetical protein BroJett025_10700 [Patescibacteria group bacterium]
MSLFLEKKYTAVDDFVVAYSDTTQIDVQKPVLVFLHGLGGDLDAFKTFREFFYKNGFRSIAVDIRGHGYSSRTRKREQYNFEKLADDVVAIIERENIANYVLIGHCLGGLVAQKVAITNPAGLKKVVLINTTPVAYPLFRHSGFSELAKRLAIVLEKKLSLKYKNGRIKHEKYIGTGDFYIPRILNDLKHTSPASYGQILSYVLNYDVLGELHKITVPVFIISGGSDKIFPTKWSRLIAKKISKSEVKVYPKGNHLFLFSSVNEVGNDILKFLSQGD